MVSAARGGELAPASESAAEAATAVAARAAEAATARAASPATAAGAQAAIAMAPVATAWAPAAVTEGGREGGTLLQNAKEGEAVCQKHATAVQRRAHWPTTEGNMTPLSAYIIPPACDRGAVKSVGAYGRGTKGQEGPKISEQVLAPSSRLQIFFICLVLMPANIHIRKFSWS